MCNRIQYFVLFFVVTAIAALKNQSNKKILYFSLEHPFVEYLDEKYMVNVSVRSWRVNRRDPVHYLNVNLTTLVTLDCNTTGEFSYFELLSNTYRQSFVDWKFKFEDILKTKLFGKLFRNNGITCPMLPKTYICNKVFFPVNDFAKNFPFPKGRWFFNGLVNDKWIFKSYCDFELKEVDIKLLTYYDN